MSQGGNRRVRPMKGKKRRGGGGKRERFTSHTTLGLVNQTQLHTHERARTRVHEWTKGRPEMITNKAGAVRHIILKQHCTTCGKERRRRFTPATEKKS